MLSFFIATFKCITQSGQVCFTRPISRENMSFLRFLIGESLSIKSQLETCQFKFFRRTWMYSYCCESKSTETMCALGGFQLQRRGKKPCQIPRELALSLIWRQSDVYPTQPGAQLEGSYEWLIWLRHAANLWCDGTVKLKLKLNIMAVIWTHQAY